jgi:carbon storage regulator CsrA
MMPVNFSLNSPLRDKECAMLVLTRKLQEQIRIGDNVTITVLRVKGQAVRIGIEAPRELRVVRGELPREKEQASDGRAEAAAAGPALSARDDATHNDVADPSLPGADEEGHDNSARRLPKLRMFNRYGAPPLRLACTHALASSEST